MVSSVQKVRQLALSCVYYLLQNSRESGHEIQFLLEIQQSCVLVLKKSELLQDLSGNLLLNLGSKVEHLQAIAEESNEKLDQSLLKVAKILADDYEVQKDEVSKDEINEIDAVMTSSNVILATSERWHRLSTEKTFPKSLTIEITKIRAKCREIELMLSACKSKLGIAIEEDDTSRSVKTGRAPRRERGEKNSKLPKVVTEEDLKNAKIAEQALLAEESASKKKKKKPKKKPTNPNGGTLLPSREKSTLPTVNESSDNAESNGLGVSPGSQIKSSGQETNALSDSGSNASPARSTMLEAETKAARKKAGESTNKKPDRKLEHDPLDSEGPSTATPTADGNPLHRQRHVQTSPMNLQTSQLVQRSGSNLSAGSDGSKLDGSTSLNTNEANTDANGEANISSISPAPLKKLLDFNPSFFLRSPDAAKRNESTNHLDSETKVELSQVHSTENIQVLKTLDTTTNTLTVDGTNIESDSPPLVKRVSPEAKPETPTAIPQVEVGKTARSSSSSVPIICPTMSRKPKEKMSPQKGPRTPEKNDTPKTVSRADSPAKESKESVVKESPKKESSNEKSTKSSSSKKKPVSTLVEEPEETLEIITMGNREIPFSVSWLKNKSKKRQKKLKSLLQQFNVRLVSDGLTCLLVRGEAESIDRFVAELGEQEETDQNIDPILYVFLYISRSEPEGQFQKLIAKSGLKKLAFGSNVNLDSLVPVVKQLLETRTDSISSTKVKEHEPTAWHSITDDIAEDLTASTQCFLTMTGNREAQRTAVSLLEDIEKTCFLQIRFFCEKWQAEEALRLERERKAELQRQKEERLHIQMLQAKYEEEKRIANETKRKKKEERKEERRREEEDRLRQEEEAEREKLAKRNKKLNAKKEKKDEKENVNSTKASAGGTASRERVMNWDKTVTSTNGSAAKRDSSSKDQNGTTSSSRWEKKNTTDKHDNKYDFPEQEWTRYYRDSRTYMPRCNGNRIGGSRYQKKLLNTEKANQEPPKSPDPKNPKNDLSPPFKIHARSPPQFNDEGKVITRDRSQLDHYVRHYGDYYGGNKSTSYKGNNTSSRVSNWNSGNNTRSRVNNWKTWNWKSSNTKSWDDSNENWGGSWKSRIYRHRKDNTNDWSDWSDWNSYEEGQQGTNGSTTTSKPLSKDSIRFYPQSMLKKDINLQDNLVFDNNNIFNGNGFNNTTGNMNGFNNGSNEFHYGNQFNGSPGQFNNGNGEFHYRNQFNGSPGQFTNGNGQFNSGGNGFDDGIGFNNNFNGDFNGGFSNLAFLPKGLRRTGTPGLHDSPTYNRHSNLMDSSLQTSPIMESAIQTGMLCESKFNLNGVVDSKFTPFGAPNSFGHTNSFLPPVLSPRTNSFVPLPTNFSLNSTSMSFPFAQSNTGLMINGGNGNLYSCNPLLTIRPLYPPVISQNPAPLGVKDLGINYVTPEKTGECNLTRAETCTEEQSDRQGTIDDEERTQLPSADGPCALNAIVQLLLTMPKLVSQVSLQWMPLTNSLDHFTFAFSHRKLLVQMIDYFVQPVNLQTQNLDIVPLFDECLMKYFGISSASSPITFDKKTMTVPSTNNKVSPIIDVTPHVANDNHGANNMSPDSREKLMKSSPSTKDTEGVTEKGVASSSEGDFLRETLSKTAISNTAISNSSVETGAGSEQAGSDSGKLVSSGHVTSPNSLNNSIIDYSPIKRRPNYGSVLPSDFICHLLEKLSEEENTLNRQGEISNLFGLLVNAPLCSSSLLTNPVLSNTLSPNNVQFGLTLDVPELFDTVFSIPIEKLIGVALQQLEDDDSKTVQVPPILLCNIIREKQGDPVAYGEKLAIARSCSEGHLFMNQRFAMQKQNMGSFQSQVDDLTTMNGVNLNGVNGINGGCNNDILGISINGTTDCNNFSGNLNNLNMDTNGVTNNSLITNGSISRNTALSNPIYDAINSVDVTSAEGIQSLVDDIMNSSQKTMNLEVPEARKTVADPTESGLYVSLGPEIACPILRKSVSSPVTRSGSPEVEKDVQETENVESETPALESKKSMDQPANTNEEFATEEMPEELSKTTLLETVKEVKPFSRPLKYIGQDFVPGAKWCGGDDFTIDMNGNLIDNACNGDIDVNNDTRDVNANANAAANLESTTTDANVDAENMNTVDANANTRNVDMNTVNVNLDVNVSLNNMNSLSNLLSSPNSNFHSSYSCNGYSGNSNVGNKSVNNNPLPSPFSSTTLYYLGGIITKEVDSEGNPSYCTYAHHGGTWFRCQDLNVKPTTIGEVLSKRKEVVILSYLKL